MTGKTINYYAGGNTAQGFYSLFDSAVGSLDRLFILKGGPGTGKSSLMKTIGSVWVEKGYDIEYIHCSSDNDSIDGIIVSELGIGIVDGTAPHVIEPKAPGAVEEYVNLGEAWDSRKLESHREEIANYTTRISDAFQSVYAVYADALAIHDEWEEIYISNMDVGKADALTTRLIDSFLGEQTLDKKAKVEHRFLGAATPKGPVDFIQNLTEDVPKRYFLKGRPGSGKSTLLKKLARSAENKGFNVEIYHCGFDPHSLDMVIVRELGFAIFDSTSPHEYFPDRESDEIIDMYEEIIALGTDEKYAGEIEDISQRYAEKMKEANIYLAEAKQLHDKLEEFYIDAMDFSKIDDIRETLEAEFDRRALKTVKK
ncbi:hypothetical protein EV207_107116 [Scopulibacillus darangshiensis]|uniref:ATPase n=1 Tax=Scopulibacillus darangshiensis TaxID=442528 RepID=A0A4R2P5G1_9BACL|nr:PRK06851 family protein [Scopulibacillus darangshiensis]TCP30022.1 hypothetical protein EV207_107116 [Scopulibacillus darangshiensis]